MLNSSFLHLFVIIFSITSFYSSTFQFLKPLSLGIQTKNLKIVEACLDCLQIWINNNFIQGSSEKSHYRESQSVLDHAIELFEIASQISSEQISAAVVRVFDAIFQSTSCVISGERLSSILTTLIVSYSVFEHCEQQTCTLTTLIQCLNFVFQRLKILDIDNSNKILMRILFFHHHRTLSFSRTSCISKKERCLVFASNNQNIKIIFLRKGKS